MKNSTDTKRIGSQSIRFQSPPAILGTASVVGRKEGEGPLANYYTMIEDDPMLGGETWEEAESLLQKQASELAILSAGLGKNDIQYLLGGDLLGQLIATSFGIQGMNIPFLGVYGACSTMGEALLLGSVLVDGGFADYTLAITSSHFAGAEKQFRFPLDYGNQRPMAATWTVTGSGAAVLGRHPDAGGRQLLITGATPGRIVDYGVKDSMNMGACMAPAAADTIKHHLQDFKLSSDYYDKIITGDLGKIGSEILCDLLSEEGFGLKDRHLDCGNIVYSEEQEAEAGGSGCGCSAITFAGYICQMLRTGKWNRVLFVPTGAMLSTVSFNEGNTVPGIAHAVVLEARGGKE